LDVEPMLKSDRNRSEEPWLPPSDRVIETFKRYLRHEPVGTSVAIGLIAAAITDSVAAFIVAGIAAWIVATHLLRKEHAERE
jgi:predicted branched-subunit amino acid permease